PSKTTGSNRPTPSPPVSPPSTPTRWPSSRPRATSPERTRRLARLAGAAPAGQPGAGQEEGGPGAGRQREQSLFQGERAVVGFQEHGPMVASWKPGGVVPVRRMGEAGLGSGGQKDGS